MDFNSDRTFSDETEDGYPILRLGYADVMLLGRWNGISNALYSLHNGGSLWVHYNTKDAPIETYTLLDGVTEIEFKGKRRQLEIGETINASEYSGIISFYATANSEILIKMTAINFEPGFFETQLLQAEADAIEAVDGYTYMHCNRIKDYAIEVWKHLSLPTERLNNLRWGAYFHDIGKRVVSVEILQKSGKLTEEEWVIMKSHPTAGAEMIRNHSVSWLKDVAFIVEQHHERYDGKGYPYGLKGHEISMEASIVSVVDAFDAMTTDRIYQPALPIPYAIQELVNCKGTQFNPEVVDAFIEVLNRINFDWE